MKKLLATICLLFIIGIVKGNNTLTAQAPDKITFKGKEYALNSNPLEPYFEKHPDKRPKNGIMSTSLWRGYIAYFELIDDQLYVVDVKIKVRNKESKKIHYSQVSVYAKIFPNTKRFKVDWYSGILILPYGKLVNYVHMGYGSTYSKYWLLEIEKGNLNEVRKYNYKSFVKFKKRQFDEFKKTEAYKELYNDLKKDDSNSEAFIEDFLMNFVINYTSKFLVK